MGEFVEATGHGVVEQLMLAHLSPDACPCIARGAYPDPRPDHHLQRGDCQCGSRLISPDSLAPNVRLILHLSPVLLCCQGRLFRTVS